MGYYNKPVATSNIFDNDGYMHTGDIGYYDELQRIYVVDRVKELIKYKGFQVKETNYQFKGRISEIFVFNMSVLGSVGDTFCQSR